MDLGIASAVPIYEKLKNKEIMLQSAAKQLGLSSRQVYTKLRRFIKEGPKGLVHRSKGRRSPRRRSQKEINKIVRIIRANYSDFGPTLAVEYLYKRHGIKIAKESLRLLMIKAGIWKPKRRRKVDYRKWRLPKECFGELVQFDGSLHSWFEERGPKATLLLFIDDATKAILWARLCESESTKNVMLTTREYFERFGKPLSLYTDRGVVYRVNHNNLERDKVTQFGRALRELGVNIVYAHSPQAKGRVERCFGTMQDRFIKDLRVNGISSLEEANNYLHNVYMPTHNRKFTVKAKRDDDLHRLIKKKELDHILCLKEDRVIRNDFTIQYNNKTLQLEEEQKAIIRPKERVIVSEHLKGELTLWIRGYKVNFHEIEKPKEKIKNPNTPKATDRIYSKQEPNHPWRNWMKRKKRGGTK